MKRLLVTTALLGLATGPAFAQDTAPATPSPAPTVQTSPAPMPPAAMPSPPTATPPVVSPTAAAPMTGGAGFMSEQQSNQWMASSVIGMSVVGPDNKTVGEVNDLLIDESGSAQAAIIGVGGFLGVGEKNVAVPFKDLQMTRKDNGKLDRVTLGMTKAEMEKAPTFMTWANRNASSRSAPAATGSTRPVQ